MPGVDRTLALLPAARLFGFLVEAEVVEVGRQLVFAAARRAYPAAGSGAEFPSLAPGMSSAGMPLRTWKTAR